MELSVYNIKGEDTGKKVVLDDAVFGIEPNDHAVYLDVKQYLANLRQGTHKSKERSEVSGSTRKLKRQKGTGGARSGDINSPVMVGGGRVFGPKPRDYRFKLNKKVKVLARKSALSYKAQENAVVVVEDLISTGGSSLKAVAALREAGFEVVGMVASYTYGFPVAEEAFKEAQLKLVTLTDYEHVVEKALEIGYIKQDDIALLNDWRKDPSNWKK